jgi:hypothetical protein
LEFETLDVAECEAAKAAEIGRDKLPQGDARDVTVDVRDGHGQRLMSVTVTLSVDREEDRPTVVPFG